MCCKREQDDGRSPIYHLGTTSSLQTFDLSQNVHVHSSVNLPLHLAATMHKWLVLETSVFKLLPVYHTRPKDEDEK